MPKSRRRPKKNNTVRNILLVIVLVLVVVLGGIFGYGYINLQPVGDGSNTIDFQIEEGSDFDEVLNDLEDQNSGWDRVIPASVVALAGGAPPRPLYDDSICYS